MTDPQIDTGKQWTQAIQRPYEPDGDEELTSAIVFAIAETKGVDPSEVDSPPLYETVDVTAIEDAFFGRDVRGSSRQGTGSVGFSYGKFLVKVRSDGWIQVYESTETEPSSRGAHHL